MKSPLVLFVLRQPWAAPSFTFLLATVASVARCAVLEAWIHTYDGPVSDNDQARAVVVDQSGDVVVTGASNNGPPDYYNDYYTAKYAGADGALLWERRYEGPVGARDVALALAVDGAGNVVVTGYSSNGTNDDCLTIKYAGADGALLWEKRYNGPANGNDVALALAVDNGGNAIVAGYSSNGTNNDCYTAKYAATNGALLWERRYNGPANAADLVLMVAVDSAGNAAVTGYSFNGTNDDYYTARYAAANGALLWDKRYNGPRNNHDRAQAVAVDGGGNVVVTGYSSNGTNDDYYTATYAAANGSLLWEKRYNGPSNGGDQARAVALDGSGNVVVTGSSFDDGSGYRFHTFKYAAADGALLWEKRSDRDTDDFAEAVAVDGLGNVVVTGYSFREESDSDFYTVKYAMADGALLWARRYNGLVNGYDFPTGPRSLAIGPDGMVAIIGSSAASLEIGNSYDYATIVYREHLPPLSIALVPTGVRLRFAGVPGRDYTLERATVVTGPWSVLASLTAPVGGLIEYIDTDAAIGSAFYRMRAP